MAKRTASAKKQARSGARRTVRNRAAKSEVKTLIVKARRAIAASSDAASERVAIGAAAIKSLDRAAAKGVLHPNNAARRKSRLARQLAKLSAAAAEEAQSAAKAASAARPGRGLRRPGRS